MDLVPRIRLTGGVEPTWDEAPLPSGSTLVVGDTQVTAMAVPSDPDAVYLVNTLTRTGSRRQGSARDLWDVLERMADEESTTLLTHPDEPWMAERLIANRGWEIVENGEVVDGKPLIRRRPKDTPCQ